MTVWTVYEPRYAGSFLEMRKNDQGVWEPDPIPYHVFIIDDVDYLVDQTLAMKKQLTAGETQDKKRCTS